MDMEVVIL